MLSLANVSAAQAENYYEKDDYYTRGDTERGPGSNVNLNPDSQWQGDGAKRLGLAGEVDKQIFKKLLHGQSAEGNPLHSKAINPNNHRAATDYTFSAPKSVSIAALIQKDKRVIAAHDLAVKTALSVLENRYAQTRVRRGPGIRERVKTGNIIAATFRHETSREQDPQLHTHCVVINATQLADGKWQSMANEDVLNNQKLLGEIYQNELAVQLRQYGYEIEPNGSGQFECKGYEESLLNLFSTRTQQIEQYIERWEAAVKTAKGKPLHAKQKKMATLATRVRKKTVPRDVLLDGWHRAVDASALYLPATPQVGHKELESRAVVSAIAGVSHAAERESVFKVERAERFALEHHLGQQSFAELQSAMTAAGLVVAKDRYTTAQAIEREQETISLMKDGQGQVEAISTASQAMRQTLEEPSLTAGQMLAISKTATSRDRVMGWQGVAGSGKTYSLKLLAQLATEQGYAVTGYAPSAQAANVLSEEANIEGNTVARLLHSNRSGSSANSAKPKKKKAIWIVDEAGLLSAKDAHALLTKAAAESARVILVGDTRQLSAVEAGNPFKSLQAGGMQTVYLEESRRQKTDALRAAVVCLNAGEQREGLDQLDRAGMVKEQPSSELRHRAIVRDYTMLTDEEREETLILSGTNAERLALTAGLREMLQKLERLGADSYQLQSLRSRDLTAEQRKYALSYDVGDVVVPVKDYRRYGMERREQYLVQGRDLKNNRVTLQAPDGRAFELNPSACADKTTYQVQEIAIAKGEQLRWTRNEAVAGVRNGQLVTVEEIDGSGRATLRNAKGEVMMVELSSGLQYLDYALVSTTYSSQGKTAARVLASIDSTLSKEGLYVAVSRAKTNLSLYTADKEQLYKRAQRSSANLNPSDYLTLIELVNPDAENKKAARTAREIRSAAQSEYVGASVGECHEAAIRRDGSNARGAGAFERTAAGISLGVRAAAAESHRAAEDASGQLAAVAGRRQQQLEQDRKWVLRRAVYRALAEHVGGGIDVQEQDLKVAQQVLIELTCERSRYSLSPEDKRKAEAVMRASPEAERLAQLGGEAAAQAYVVERLTQANRQIMAQVQKERDGLEM